MRIALVAPPWIAVPPAGYGGIEWVVHLLAEELVRGGHDVTLYATGDSATSAELVSFIPTSAPARMHDAGTDAEHAGQAFRHIAQRAAAGAGADVVHDHSEWLGPAFAHALPMPVVFTHHNDLNADRRRVYGAFFDDVHHVCLSEHQRASWPALAGASVVPNAIDLPPYDASVRRGDFLLCLSRIHPDKGQHIAIEVGRKTGRRVVLAGKIDPGEGERYFAAEIAPCLEPGSVEYLGEITDGAKRDLLRRAAATLFPIRWDEPFGLVMAESMASGTPCIAFARGAAPEVIEHGVTGFVVDAVDGMAAAVSRLAEISPAACRRHVETNFAPAVMTRRYLEVYASVVALAPRVQRRQIVELPR